MMKKTTSTLFALLFVVGNGLFFNACTTDFESINRNPNEPIAVTGDLLLPTAIFDLANLMVGETYNFGEIISQYAAAYEYNQLDIYNWTSDDRFWYLYDILQNIKDIKQYGIQNNLPNYEAVGLVLETFCYSILTDAYGDVPFAQSNRAEEGIIAPAYDAQEEIYDAMLAALERANAIIDLDGSVAGDILYDGNLMKWKKFANSLRIRLLMRTSAVRSNVGATLQAMLDDPTTYPLFASNADEAIYFYTGVQPDISPVSIGVGREYEYYIGVPTTHFVNLLLAHNDPRIHEWLDEKVNDDGTLAYIGLEPGKNLGDIGRPVDFCTKAAEYFTDPAKVSAALLTFAELHFLLAEAAERKLVTANAQAHYEAGVAASFAQWGVAMPANFLAAEVPYQAGNLDRLFEQKWLALYHCGAEAWFDWKRTGKPDFIQPGAGNINNNLVPVRLMYPSLEQSVNAAHYQSAAQRIGGDNINTRVWWDKK